MRKFKVVIDTNVWISALFWRGKPRKIYDLFVEDKILTYFSEATFKEWIEKISKLSKLFNKEKEIKLLGKLIKNRAVFLEPVKEVKVCRDPKDNMVLEIAEVSNSKYIISGDKDLLSLKKYKSIKIVSPSQFLKMIESSEL